MKKYADKIKMNINLRNREYITLKKQISEDEKERGKCIEQDGIERIKEQLQRAKQQSVWPG